MIFKVYFKFKRCFRILLPNDTFLKANVHHLPENILNGYTWSWQGPTGCWNARTAQMLTVTFKIKKCLLYELLKKSMTKCTQKLKSESSEKFYSKKTFKSSLIWHFPNLNDERKEILLLYSNNSYSILRETSPAGTDVFLKITFWLIEPSQNNKNILRLCKILY